MTNEDYLIKRYENYQLEDEIAELRKINNDLKKENERLEKKNKKIEKENKHFKSTKAYKVWKKYAGIKDDSGKDKKTSSKDKSSAKKDKTSKKEKSSVESNKTEAKNLKDIKVAFISDQFTYDSFKYEFNLISIDPKKWKSQFKREKPDIFFCESTWHGHNYTGNEGPWDKKILKYHDNSGSRKILFKILEYCKKKKIPTVFWNKEDPVHYNNEAVSAADTAQHFDYIFTSTVECVEWYKRDYNHPNVYPLLFAGQPKLFNPLNLSTETIEEVVFAGSYNPRHKERNEKLEDVVDRILKQWKNIRIYDRFYYQSWTKFPDKYDDYVHPPIDYNETPNLYKKMKWGLNLNTVTESKTMFARRVYELSLTNTNILTNYSVAVDEIFKDNVFFFDKMDDLPNHDGDYEDMRLNNLYNVLENHTYTNRWKYILDTINFPYTEDNNEACLIFKTDEGRIDKACEKFESIDYPYKRLNLLIPNKIQNIDEIKKKYPIIENIYFEDSDDYKKEIKEYIEGNNIEYWIVIDKDIDDDFIKKAILHYQYLNKRVSIVQGINKFELGLKNDIENIIINKVNLDYLSDEESDKELERELDIDVYYI